MSKINVAIDGPSGAGKSSLAKEAARKTGLIHLDTGKMYRAISCYLDEQNIPPASGSKLDQILNKMEMEVQDDSIVINGKVFEQQLYERRTSEITSNYAALAEIRDKLVELQQSIASKKGYILDGRDICTVVLPDAELKLYIDASDEQRAKRRMEQNAQMGIASEYEEVLEAIRKRDEKDRNRSVSPLIKSDEAIEIDNGAQSFEESLKEIVRLIEEAERREYD